MLEIGLEQDQTAWAWGTRKQEKDLWPPWAVRYGTRVDDAETPGWVGGGGGLTELFLRFCCSKVFRSHSHNA